VTNDDPQGAAGDEAPSLSTEEVAAVLKLLKGSDSVELKISVPEDSRRSTVATLGMDPLDAQIRQVAFFDTPDLLLNRHGVVVRARRIARKPGDAVVKLRPIVPENVPAGLRKSPAFGIELDAMPGGYVCSGSLKEEVDDAVVRSVLRGDRPVRKLFSKEQQELFSANAPPGVQLDDLAMLGPVNVLKLKFTPKNFAHRVTAELWYYPDGSRVLELSTKCPPADAFSVAAETRAFLKTSGVDVSAAQQTKTKKALEFYAAELAPAPAAS
jgi:hypothetical protein